MTRSSPANPWQALGRQGWGAYGLGGCAMDLRTLILLFYLSFVNPQSCGAGHILQIFIVVLLLLLLLLFCISTNIFHVLLPEQSYVLPKRSKLGAKF